MTLRRARRLAAPLQTIDSSSTLRLEKGRTSVCASAAGTGRLRLFLRAKFFHACLQAQCRCCWAFKQRHGPGARTLQTSPQTVGLGSRRCSVIGRLHFPHACPSSLRSAMRSAIHPGSRGRHSSILPPKGLWCVVFVDASTLSLGVAERAKAVRVFGNRK